MQIRLNETVRQLSEKTTVEQLLQELGHDSKRVAVELNREVLPREVHPSTQLKENDQVEIVTLVGGGSDPLKDKPLKVGKFTFQSRLFTGTGKYANYGLMKESLELSGCEVTTVAVRRERLIDTQGRNLLDYLDLSRYTILPNTAGCFNAEDAIRHARLARELLKNLENPGADWVKLECLGDKKTLLPDPIDTLKATEQLVKEGFQVLVYTSDDVMLAKRLKEAGAVSVMPAGSPIGSGQGILNPNSIRIILEYLKENDPDYPVIVDAGVGTASDVAFAMELGCDGVLLNTSIASAENPLRMAHAMRWATEAGRQAYLAGRIPRKMYATASSPMEGRISASK
ncbi:sulfur carrier protein ThiS [Telmatocola sphagniphila]|uniref:Thiazole synthase n=1 Tax=Telmatocola sphagniphila TaxID=1123043 RepID=A0A8E6B6K1_9BACT|nr:sulfur carrier protein ThiS [Telmatocola sphagniphila]QVL32832.1 sulfur carrier protein ThiS [Telmatocola sphagniphila]